MFRHMTVHLLKTAAGVPDLDALARRQQARRGRTPQGRPAVRASTRFMPKRADEVLDGGSLYWIVKGQIAARNRVLALAMGDDEMGPNRCQIYLDPTLVPLMPVRKRPVQGWRYLEPKAAPADLPAPQAGSDPLPADLASELRELALL